MPLFALYNILLILAFPFVVVYYIVRVIIGKDTIFSFLHKLGWHCLFSKVYKYDLWLHAASVGEVKSLEFIINHNYNKRILITTTTIKSAEVVKGYQNLNIHHKFLPIDFPPLLIIFLLKNRCKRVIIAESELWPNFFTLLRIFCKQVTLYNARISKHSQKVWLKIPSLLKFILKTCNGGVIAQSVSTKTFLEKFTHTHYFGNLKMLNLKYPNIKDSTIETFQTKPIICVASTHIGEDDGIIQAIKPFLKEYKIIYIPRHPHRCGEISTIMQKYDISHQMYSGIDERKNCLIVDKIGILLQALSVSQIAIFGGSFLPHLKGHNILEGAMFSCKIITGHFVESFEEIIQEMLIQNAIIQCNIEEIANNIACANPKIGLNAKKFVEDNIPNEQQILEFITK